MERKIMFKWILMIVFIVVWIFSASAATAQVASAEQHRAQEVPADVEARGSATQAFPDTSVYALIYRATQRPDSQLPGSEARIEKLTTGKELGFFREAFVRPERLVLKNIMYVYQAQDLWDRPAEDADSSFWEGFSIIDDSTFAALRDNPRADYRIQMLAIQTDSRLPRYWDKRREDLYRMILHGAVKHGHLIVTDLAIERASHVMKIVSVVDQE